jgi:hypothetical protein
MTRDVVVSTATLALNIAVVVLLVLNYRATNARTEATNAQTQATNAQTQAINAQTWQLEGTREQLRCINDE